MAPQSGSSSPAALPQEDEEATRRMMAKRVKIIAELMQTERDYISDLDLCIKEVIQPLRNKQVSTGGGGWGGGDVKVQIHPRSVCRSSQGKHKCQPEEWHSARSSSRAGFLKGDVPGLQ